MATEVATITFAANTSGIQKAEKELNKLDNTAESTDKSIVSLEDDTRELNKTIDRSNSEFRQLSKEVKSADNAVRSITGSTGTLNKSLGFVSSASAKANRETKSLAKSVDNVSKVNGLAASNVTRLTSSFRAQKGASQQVAFQLQDIAVQLQGGVTASRTLSQQLPQMFGVFGAGGAILGLFASLASVAFAPFIDGLFASKDASGELDKTLKLLDDTIKETKDDTFLLSEEFERLAKRSETLAQVEIKRRLIDAVQAGDLAFKQMKNSAEDLDFALKASGQAQRGVSANIKRLAADYGITRKELVELRDLTQQAFSSGTTADASALSNRISELATSSERVTPEFIKLASNINAATREMEKSQERTELLKNAQEDLAGTIATSSVTAAKAIKERETATQRALENEIKAEERRASLTEQTNIRNLERLRASLMTEEQAIEASALARLQILKTSLDEGLIARSTATELGLQIEQQFQNELLKIDEANKARKEKENKAQVQQGKQFFGELSGLMSSESKKLFEIGKAASIANATIKGVESGINAYAFGSSLGGPVLGAVFAGLSAVATGAMIGELASARPPGRAQGGQVRPGQSFRVGEFGPETLTMGSNGGVITPNQPAANDSKIDLVTNVKIIGGDSNSQVSNTTRQVSDKKFIQDIVVDMMSNPSSRGRQGLQNTSNVQPRGTR